jgi:tetratricopeptide (TPR) repeat protein
MLDHALSTFGGKRGGSPAGEALAKADKLYGEGRNAEAAKAYREALNAAPANWGPYSRAVESLIYALYATKQYEEAARLSLKAYPKVKRSVSAANVAGFGLDCALSMAKDDSMRAKLIDSLVANAQEVTADSTLEVAADDRSAVFISLLDAREDAGDEAKAKEVAKRWADFLEGEAAKAKTPDARAVFDSHRLSAYLELGEPERAIPMLEASERDLPDDYNPPARLAIVYQKMGEWDKALAASSRALSKAYGPRRLSYLRTRASIYVDMGDTVQARATLKQAIEEANALPEGQRSDRRTVPLEKMLEKLSK